ncbi:glycosyl hydrolase family 28-related protein [Paenibacillus lautus]|uniref:glycosyl hydrolase family 28-related protein n=1 Tax=Paenibacillus lautus TaxID=1401 RepID=UPI003D2CF42A
MASRYGGITGSKRISEDFQNINLAFENVQVDMDARKNETGSVKSDLSEHKISTTAHKAENITYMGQVPGNDVKAAIDNVNGRISEIVAQSGDDITEIVDARGGFPVLGDRLNAFEESLGDTIKKGDYVYNLRDFGAVGDGVDDTQAFINAIASIPERGVLFIPDPEVTYRINQKLIIDKPITICGTTLEVNTQKATFTFSTGVFTGFEVSSPDTSIKNISIKLEDITSSVIAGIYYNSDENLSNSMLENVFIHLNHSFGIGVKGRNVIVSEFKNVRAYQGTHGFYFSIGTSIKFDTCWAMSSIVTGYYVESYQYIDFINCACDSGNSPNHAYHLNFVRGAVFNGCGAEGIGKEMFRFQSSNGIVLNGCFGTGLDNLGTGDATFATITNNSLNITIIGCVDLANPVNKPYVTVSGDYFPVIIGSNFSKYSQNGTIFTDPFLNRANIRLGGLSLYESPFGGTICVATGRGLGFSKQPLGVMDESGGVWLGNFDVDGGIFVGKNASLPAASSSLRGKIIRIEGGTGVADSVYICRKKADNTYEWAKMD